MAYNTFAPSPWSCLAGNPVTANGTLKIPVRFIVIIAHYVTQLFPLANYTMPRLLELCIHWQYPAYLIVLQ